MVMQKGERLIFRDEQALLLGIPPRQHISAAGYFLQLSMSRKSDLDIEIGSLTSQVPPAAAEVFDEANGRLDIVSLMINELRQIIGPEPSS